MNTVIRTLAIVIVILVFALGASAYMFVTGQTLEEIIPSLFITIGVVFLIAAATELKPFRRNKPDGK